MKNHLSMFTLIVITLPTMARAQGSSTPAVLTLEDRKERAALPTKDLEQARTFEKTSKMSIKRYLYR